MRLFFFSFMGGLAWTLICVARLAWLNRISRDATPRVRRSLPGEYSALSHRHNDASASFPMVDGFRPSPARFSFLFAVNGGLK